MSESREREIHYGKEVSAMKKTIKVRKNSNYLGTLLG
jgi:hypothetical protein